MHKDSDRKMAERVRMLRLSRQMTLKDIGKLLGCTPQQAWNYERNRSKIPARLVPKFAEIFNVSVNDLYWEDSIALFDKEKNDDQD